MTIPKFEMNVPFSLYFSHFFNNKTQNVVKNFFVWEKFQQRHYYQGDPGHNSIDFNFYMYIYVLSTIVDRLNVINRLNLS